METFSEILKGIQREVSHQGTERDPVRGETRQGVAGVLSQKAEIAAKRNRFDLSPNIKFVTDHLELFEQGLRVLLERRTDVMSESFARHVKIDGEPGVSPHSIFKCKFFIPIRRGGLGTKKEGL